MSTTPKLGVGLLATNTAQKEVVVNEALVTFDALLARSALARQNSAPGSPADGATYIVGTAPTGAWASHANKIAFYFNGWRFINPTQKMKFFVESVSQWWTYSGTSWTADPVGSVSTLDDLTNVSVASPGDNDVLQYDGGTGQWVAQQVEITLNLADLDDVNLTDLANGRMLAWSAVTGKWVAVAPPAGGGATALAGLTDVDMGAAATGRFFRWNASAGKAEWASIVFPDTPQLSQLPDVVTSGAAPGDVLAWNGAAWGPSPAVITYSFLGMVDGPQTFDGHANKFLVVDPTESEMTFKSVDDLFNSSDFKLQTLGDVPAVGDAHIGKYLRLRKVGANFDYTYEMPADTKVALLANDSQLTASLLSLNLKGFEVSEDTEGHITVTAQNALEFQADGENIEGDPISAINFTGSGVGVTNVEGVVTVTIENGGGSLETLDDVDMGTPPTHGQALVFDAIDAKWKPGEGAGGSLPEIDGEAEPATYELGPFAPPAGAMFPDRWNSPSADITLVRNRGLVVQPGPQASGARHAGISHLLLNNQAPWVVTARVVPSGFQVNGHAGGIFLQRTANSSAVFIDLGASNNDTQHVTRFGSVSAAGAETITLSRAQEFNWLRLSYDGNTIYAHVSTDGLIWQLFGTLGAAAVLGGPPDRVGIENRSAAAHAGEVGTLVTYYDDPDFPAASRIQQGVVALGVSGLADVDIETVAPDDGQALVWNEEEGKWVPGDASGVTTLAALTDVDTATAPPTVGQALIWDDVQQKWVPGDGSGGVGGIATEFDISMFIPGVPEADELVAIYIAARDFMLPAGLEGSFAYADIPPSGEVIFTLLKNGAAIGTLTFPFGEYEGVFAFDEDVAFDAGQRLTIHSPVGLQGLTDLSITFAGSRL